MKYKKMIIVLILVVINGVVVWSAATKTKRQLAIEIADSEPSVFVNAMETAVRNSPLTTPQQNTLLNAILDEAILNSRAVKNRKLSEQKWLDFKAAEAL